MKPEHSRSFCTNHWRENLAIECRRAELTGISFELYVDASGDWGRVGELGDTMGKRKRKRTREEQRRAEEENGKLELEHIADACPCGAARTIDPITSDRSLHGKLSIDGQRPRECGRIRHWPTVNRILPIGFHFPLSRKLHSVPRLFKRVFHLLATEGPAKSVGCGVVLDLDESLLSATYIFRLSDCSIPVWQSSIGSRPARLP